MVKRFITGISFFILTLFYQCDLWNTESPPPDYNLSIEAIDVECVDAIFKVSTGNTLSEDEGWTCGLFRNDNLIITQDMDGESDFIRDENLEPSTSYTYHIGWMENNVVKDVSDPITITTMDTTSHDFEWEIITLGNYGSYLRDVAIIDENNIWVVGYIKTDTADYNAAHWNGSVWEKIQILRPADFEGIFTISDNDIWFADGCKIFHYDGNEIKEMWMCDFIKDGINQVTSIWGSSPNDIWFVGNSGSIVHYDGENFERIESGTDVDLTDICGIGSNNIFFSGFEQHNATVILNWNGESLQTFYRNQYNEYVNLDYDKISGPIISIWPESENYYWVISYW